MKKQKRKKRNSNWIQEVWILLNTHNFPTKFNDFSEFVR